MCLLYYTHGILRALRHATRPMLAAVLLQSIAPGAAAESAHILFVSSQTAAPYLRFIEQIQQELKTANPATVTTTTMNAEHLDDSSGSASARHYDLVVALGTQAAQALARWQPDTPVLYTLIPEVTWQELRQSGRLPCSNRHCTVVFIDQPLSRLLDIAVSAFPKPPRIGVLFGPTSARQHEVLAQLGQQRGLSVMTRQIENRTELLPALDGLLKESDLLLAIADPVVYNSRTTQSVLLTTYRYRVPVLAYSKAYADAGAALSVYSTPEQLARQSATIIKTYLGNRQAGLPSPEHPRYYSVRVNQRVADSLDLELGRNAAFQSIIEAANDEQAHDSD